MLAGSEKVTTFASAFKKNGCSYKDWKFTIKELKALCKPDFPRREVLKKIFEKRFAGFKKLLYLCSPFALQNARLFQTGSLNYWLYFERKEM